MTIHSLLWKMLIFISLVSQLFICTTSPPTRFVFLLSLIWHKATFILGSGKLWNVSLGFLSSSSFFSFPAKLTWRRWLARNSTAVIGYWQTEEPQTPESQPCLASFSWCFTRRICEWSTHKKTLGGGWIHCLQSYCCRGDAVGSGTGKGNPQLKLHRWWYIRMANSGVGNAWIFESAI